MDFVIRKAVPEDARDYAACHIACWRDAYTGIITDDFLDDMQAKQEEHTEQCLQYLQESGDFKFYYAEICGKMIGRLVFGKSRDDDKPDAGEIGAIYLLADYWGKGYGKQMMDFAISELKRTGYQEIIAWVLEENKRAEQFYNKYGFIQDGKKETSKWEKH